MLTSDLFGTANLVDTSTWYFLADTVVCDNQSLLVIALNSNVLFLNYNIVIFLVDDEKLQ